MNYIEFERDEMLRKMKKKGIQIYKEIKPLTLKEYAKEKCSDLRRDIHLIENTYYINGRKIYKYFAKLSYEKTLKNPRAIINYNKKRIELYEIKMNYNILVDSIQISL